jgi:nucleotide-binding universal stress UspA family protein
VTTTVAPVVVGVDGSEASKGALNWAVREAQIYGPRMYPALVDTQTCEQETRAEPSELIAGWRERYPDVPITETVAQSHPVEALVRASQTADLVVVGCRGRGVRGMLLGSVSQGLIRHAHCPVAVVHGHHNSHHEREQR